MHNKVEDNVSIMADGPNCTVSNEKRWMEASVSSLPRRTTK